MNLRNIEHSTAQPPIPAPMPMAKWCERHAQATERPSLLARARMAMKARDARAGGR